MKLSAKCCLFQSDFDDSADLDEKQSAQDLGNLSGTSIVQLRRSDEGEKREIKGYFFCATEYFPSIGCMKIWTGVCDWVVVEHFKFNESNITFECPTINILSHSAIINQAGALFVVEGSCHRTGGRLFGTGL